MQEVRRLEEQFLDKLGFLEQLYGTVFPYMAYSARRERRREIYKHVYGFEDVDQVLPPIVDRRNIEAQTKIMM